MFSGPGRKKRLPHHLIKESPGIEMLVGVKSLNDRGSSLRRRAGFGFGGNRYSLLRMVQVLPLKT